MARNRTPILEHEIKEANEHTGSCAEAARYLEVGYKTYKRYAKMYGLFLEQKNPGSGDHTKQSFSNPVYAFDDVLAGKYPEYPPVRIKQRGLRNGHFDHECESCGFSESRITDGHMPLFLNFKNGDSSDHRPKNMEILCWNCAHLLVGDVVLDDRAERHLMKKWPSSNPRKD